VQYWYWALVKERLKGKGERLKDRKRYEVCGLRYEEKP
jgi:hypothetical protein